MAEEKEKNPSALEELRQLKRTDRIKSLDIHEPELQDFNAQTIFHIDEEPEKKTIFGKRSTRTHVKINANVFDDEIAKAEDITPATSLDEVEAPIEKKVVEPKKVISQEKAQEKIMDEMHVEPSKEEGTNDFTTESIKKELNAKPVEDQIEEVIEDEEEKVQENPDEKEIVDDQEDIEVEDDDEDNLYEEKKKFLFADYPKIEDYLQEKSMDGYHFVRHEGKKYFFRKGQPKTYYYSMNYFFEEPDADQWRQWEKDGWKLVSKSGGKKKDDAGWFTFRNEEEDGEYRKEIDNESEKYRFFKKYSISCRSTMFLVFICMACCAVTGVLQYLYQGYLIGIALCVVLFLIAFIVFCMYGRMLRKSKKRARQLKSRLRLKESHALESSKDYFDTSESEEELDTDWNTIEQHYQKPKKHFFSRMANDEEEEDEDYYIDEDQ